eukprot:3339369-Pyramimonas_sp.AAC.1
MEKSIGVLRKPIGIRWTSTGLLRISRPFRWKSMEIKWTSIKPPWGFIVSKENPSWFHELIDKELKEIDRDPMYIHGVPLGTHRIPKDIYLIP